MRTRPRRCPVCGQGILEQTKRDHRICWGGRPLIVRDLDMLACDNRDCGETFTDDDAARRIDLAYVEAGMAD